ncbi:MAG: OmpA family protein [Acidobacteria bacterium]|nr:OmpA family protein [Acidobacteriota bacterium]
MSRKRPDDHPNHERWLVSYADFITLLFAFFTVLYAISSVDSKKMNRLVMAMQMAFDTQGFPGKDSKIGLSQSESSPTIAEQLSQGILPPSVTATSRRINPNPSKAIGVDRKNFDIDIIKARVEEAIREEILTGKVSVLQEDRGLVVSLAEHGFFDSGKAFVRPDALPILDKLASSLSGLPNHVRIEGHTDNMPINTAQFPSNWELSTARATFIIQYMLSRFRFPPETLSAAGYGEYRPVATNDTPAGRAKNRRVDIVILNEIYTEREEPVPYTESTGPSQVEAPPELSKAAL